MGEKPPALGDARSQVAAQRRQLETTVGELKTRLAPQHLAEQARTQVTHQAERVRQEARTRLARARGALKEQALELLQIGQSRSKAWAQQAGDLGRSTAHDVANGSREWLAVTPRPLLYMIPSAVLSYAIYQTLIRPQPAPRKKGASGAGLWILGLALGAGLAVALYRPGKPTVPPATR